MTHLLKMRQESFCVHATNTLTGFNKVKLETGAEHHYLQCTFPVYLNIMERMRAKLPTTLRRVNARGEKGLWCETVSACHRGVRDRNTC